jgi:hypothetical protein
MIRAFTLYSTCAAWLKQRLPLTVFALLPLLLAATPATAPTPPARVSRVGTATVQIIRAEPVSAEPRASEVKKPDRQYRRRDEAPLVEFY